MRIDFDPIRTTDIAGTQGFSIEDFAVTQDGNKVVISGNQLEGASKKCGLFEISVSTGVARRILKADCDDHWLWTDLAISPTGDRAVANYRNTHFDHSYRLELVDMARGTTTCLGDLSRPTWSPDGRWIAAIEWNKKHLVLLDANGFSHRRNLGSTVEAAWSPDSKYLLVFKYHFLNCGFALDVEPPASLEVVEVASGYRSLIRSSRCQVNSGSIGWMASNIQR